MTFPGAGGCGMSDVYRLNSMGVRTLPWGTPVLNWRVVYVWFLNVVQALRSLAMVGGTLVVKLL